MKKKFCKGCNEDKDLSEFYVSSVVKGVKYLATRCKSCHYKRSRKKYAELKAWYIDYKSKHPCENCGEKRYYVLDFHHKDPEKKEFDLGLMIRRICSKKRILAEIKKCRVLCSNCHRELHYLEGHEEL